MQSVSEQDKMAALGAVMTRGATLDLSIGWTPKKVKVPPPRQEQELPVVEISEERRIRRLLGLGG